MSLQSGSSPRWRPERLGTVLASINRRSQRTQIARHWRSLVTASSGTLTTEIGLPRQPRKWRSPISGRRCAPRVAQAAGSITGAGTVSRGTPVLDAGTLHFEQAAAVGHVTNYPDRSRKPVPRVPHRTGAIAGPQRYVACRQDVWVDRWQAREVGTWSQTGRAQVHRIDH